MPKDMARTLKVSSQCIRASVGKGQEVAWSKVISVAFSFGMVIIKAPLVYMAIRRCGLRH